MNRYFFIFLSLVLSFPVWSQTDTRVAQNIKGKVINQITNEAVAYTNLELKALFTERQVMLTEISSLKFPGKW
jgi:hypothetical protein